MNDGIPKRTSDVNETVCPNFDDTDLGFFAIAFFRPGVLTSSMRGLEA